MSRRRKHRSRPASPIAPAADSSASPACPISRRFHACALVSIVAITCAAYANSVDVPFTYDDRQNIASNSHIQLADLSLAGLWGAAVDSPSPRPIANVTFALNYLAGGSDVWGYHVVNIVVHMVNGILVYLFAIEFGRRIGVGEGHSNSMLFSFALAAAILFVSHPVQTQSVTDLVQRMTSLTTMCYMAALLCFFKGRVAIPSRTRVIWWIASAALWLLALGSKQFAVTLPAAVLLCKWFLFQDVRRDWLRKGVIYVVPILLLALGAALVFKGSDLPRLFTRGFAQRDCSLLERLLTQTRIIVHYATLLVWPAPSRLTLVYDFPLSRSLFSPPSTLFCLFGIAGSIGAAILFAQRFRVAAFCVLWFLLHLVVESTILPLELVHEHRLYLPLVSAALLFAWTLLSSIRSPRIALGIALFVSCVLAACTHLRNHDWRDPVRFWADNVEKAPAAPRAHFNLGASYALAGQIEQAIDSFKKTLELEPRMKAAHVRMGYLLSARGDQERALAEYNIAISMKPIEIYRDQLYTEAYAERGLVHMRMGSPRLGITDLNVAIESDPNRPLSFLHRGLAFRQLERWDRAVGDIRQALRLDPNSTAAHNDYAWFLATCPDRSFQNGMLAIQHAKRACELTGHSNFEMFDTLAASHARAGNFKEAVKWQQKCLDMAPTKAKKPFAKRLELYLQKKAFDEVP